MDAGSALEPASVANGAAPLMTHSITEREREGENLLAEYEIHLHIVRRAYAQLGPPTWPFP